jgi:hypothetical protein
MPEERKPPPPTEKKFKVKREFTAADGTVYQAGHQYKVTSPAETQADLDAGNIEEVR